jgi:hypothetical protein
MDKDYILLLIILTVCEIGLCLQLKKKEIGWLK